MQVPSTKSLGVHFDQNLNWIVKKIASALRAVERIPYLVPFNVVINVFNSLIQP